MSIEIRDVCKRWGKVVGLECSTMRLGEPDGSVESAFR